MIFWIVTGMFLLDEIQFYSATKLIVIFIAVLICSLGVYFLVSKKTFLKREVIYEQGGFSRSKVDESVVSIHQKKGEIPASSADDIPPNDYLYYLLKNRKAKEQRLTEEKRELDKQPVIIKL